MQYEKGRNLFNFPSKQRCDARIKIPLKRRVGEWRVAFFLQQVVKYNFNGNAFKHD